jgi:arginase
MKWPWRWATRWVAAEADLVGLTITEFAPANEEEARHGAIVISQICQAASGSQPR